MSQIDLDGTINIVGEVEVILSPVTYNLYQNYPNPFNPVTNIEFSIPQVSRVSLAVYNILGQKVMDLINNEYVEAGIHKFKFNADNLASGIYIYKLTTDSWSDFKKMVLLK